jgi:transcription antitermination factor NusG
VLIKDKAENMQKFFEVGESVRVLQGVHSGESGLVIEILKPDATHAVLLMEDTK